MNTVFHGYIIRGRASQWPVSNISKSFFPMDGNYRFFSLIWVTKKNQWDAWIFNWVVYFHVKISLISEKSVSSKASSNFFFVELLSSKALDTMKRSLKTRCNCSWFAWKWRQNFNQFFNPHYLEKGQQKMASKPLILW